MLAEPRIGRGERRLTVGRDRSTEGVEPPVLAEQLLGQRKYDVEETVQVLLR